MNLAQVTTLRLGGPAGDVVYATDEATLIDAVRSADEADTPLLLVGGGSNLVVADDGFDGVVALVRTRGVRVEPEDSDSVAVTAAAGENWDDLVVRAVRENWVGIEALSGIPGSVGATPIQNVGAYGQQVADTVVSVRVFDRAERRIRTMSHADCGFSYRDSTFKRHPQRYVVLSVVLRLDRGDLGTPVAYDELARNLGVDPGERVSLAQVRDTVLALRRGKGMVLDADDHDTWSAGSFFTNPVLDADEAARLPAAAPRFAQPDGRIKTSAAWLIDHAGFAKGYGTEHTRLSSKHVLALTNRGTATTKQMLDLAREVRDGVERRFGVRLVNEPVLVGARL